MNLFQLAAAYPAAACAVIGVGGVAAFFPAPALLVLRWLVGTEAGRYICIAALVVAAFALARFGTAPFQVEKTASGIEFRTIKAGSGDRIKAVDGVYLEYEGRLADGKVFDSTQGKPVPMVPGQVIPGWDQGLEGMKVGGRRKLTIPPELAYGQNGSPPAIGPNETLIFVIDLKKID